MAVATGRVKEYEGGMVQPRKVDRAVTFHHLGMGKAEQGNVVACHLTEMQLPFHIDCLVEAMGHEREVHTETACQVDEFGWHAPLSVAINRGE